MPENTDPQLIPPQLIWLNNRNDIWMEIPRYEGIMWGGALFMIFFLFTIFTPMSFYSFSMLMDDFDYTITIIIFIYITLMWSSIFLFYKLYFIIPRDQPIRLNRKRQKIYTFDYKRKWWNPWARWPTTIRAFSWADVYGEMCFSSDRYTGGVQLFGAVGEPDTLNVTERFQIAGGSPTQLHQLWSYLCLYMKGEPVPEEAVNPGRPDFWCPRKADKWPEEMERESTTAPEAENKYAGITDIWKALRLNPPT
ncbi:hypothetical protein AC791_03270 [Klebsiella sp. RIT-PI-d]|nr:hypothetical protein AC791_03270 [Klebsiella sp. RIT-PI-d]